MNIRLTTSLLMALALVSGLSACGGNSKSSTSAAESVLAGIPGANASDEDGARLRSDGDSATPKQIAPPTIDPAQFDEKLAAARSLLDEATGEFCDVVAGTQGVARISQAATPEQVEKVYALFRDSLIKMADHAPPGFPGDADAITTAAHEAYNEAEAGDFDPKMFNLQTAPPSMMTPEFLDAMSHMNASIDDTCEAPSEN